MEKYVKYLETWIKNQVDNAKADGVVLGISGGIDSAVVSVISKRVFGDKALVLIMPCDSEKQDKEDAMQIIEKFNLNYREIDLTFLWKESKKLLNSNQENAAANIKSRLRMMSTYNVGQENNLLVIGTSNRDELYLGFFTKNGDGASDLMPIANLSKEEVYKIAKYLEIPKNIINKQPSAGLVLGQTDEGDMGFTYKEVDLFLNSNKPKQEVEEKIKKLHASNLHKTTSIPKAEGYCTFTNKTKKV